MMLKIYTLSYLVFFSIFGTATRLVSESLAFYPGAPVTTSVLWVNFAGSLVIGFLNEDLSLFRSHIGRQASIESPAESEAVQKADAAKRKKIIPLYLGLTTGFCGCLTSFSTFLRDVFLAISNDIPSAYCNSLGPSIYMLPSAANRAPSAGYSFLAATGIVLLEIGLSLMALFLGAHMAIFAARWIPTLPLWTTERVLDNLMVVLAPVLWLSVIVLAIWLPPSPSDKTVWSRETWRGPQLYSLCLSPVGCLLRFYLALQYNGRIPSFPLGTFSANVGGTMVLGIGFSLQHSSIPISNSTLGGGSYTACQLLQAVMEGFCGSLTTVSTWVLELSTLRRGHAYVYGMVSLVVSLIVLVVEVGPLRWTKGFVVPACFV